MDFIRSPNRKQARTNETTLATYYINDFILWDLGNVAVAMRTQLSGDQYHQITTYKFSHPNTTEVQLVGSATDPFLSVDVHQVGCLYLPVEDKWWIGG